MKIVVLDGYTEDPGDLSWEGLERLGAVEVYDRTPVGDVEEILRRMVTRGLSSAAFYRDALHWIRRGGLRRGPGLRHGGNGL